MNKSSSCINSNFLFSTRSFPYLGPFSPYALLKLIAKTNDTQLYSLSTFGNGIIDDAARSTRASANRQFLSENDSFQMTECSKAFTNLKSIKTPIDCKKK